MIAYWHLRFIGSYLNNFNALLQCWIRAAWSSMSKLIPGTVFENNSSLSGEQDGLSSLPKRIERFPETCRADLLSLKHCMRIFQNHFLRMFNVFVDWRGRRSSTTSLPSLKAQCNSMACVFDNPELPWRFSNIRYDSTHAIWLQKHL